MHEFTTVVLLGLAIYTLVNLARHLRLNPEDALRTGARRFYERFTQMEDAARREGKDLRELEMADLDRLWEAAKREPAQ